MTNNDLYRLLAGTLEKAMDERCRKDKIAGMSLVLADETGPVLACRYGYADLDARTPFTEDTLMGVASVSKLFNATGVMRLVEAGKMALDAPVTAYIPEFTVKTRFENAPPIRVIDLMTHHAGLPRDWLNHFYAYQPEPFQTVVQYLKDEYACRPAGYYYSYSNLAIALLGTVMERAAGVPYARYITDHVLRPIGMENSAYEKAYPLCGLYAQSYDGLKRSPELPIRDKPGGGLISSAREMGHFIALYLNGGTYKGAKILSPETTERMFTPQMTDAPMSFGKRMGLGWHLNRPALEYAGRVAHHGGALVNFRSEVCLLPDHGLGVAILSNSSTATAAILELAETALSEALRIKKGIEPQKPSATAFVMRTGVTETTPEGLYATSRGVVDIRADQEGCAFRWNGRALRLKDNADGTYTVCRRTAEGLAPDERFCKAPLRFCRDPLGGMKALLIGTWPDGEEFVKQPIPKAWLNRQGEYKAFNRMPEEAWADIMNGMRLTVRGGILYMDIIGPGYRFRRVLKALGDREALRLGWAQGENETLHALERGKGEILRFMGIEFRKTGEGGDA